MRKNYETVKDYRSSIYSFSANKLLVTLGALKGEVNSDICVIGGGFTGLSAALELAEKGYGVTLLEAKTIASGASGLNGGHILRGFDKSPEWLAAKYGAAAAKTLCNLSLEGLGLILERITKHDIQCDLKFGHLTAALNKKHCTELKNYIREWKNIGHDDLQYLDDRSTQALVKTKKYVGGLYDPKGAHFNPLNYALGLAAACQKAGVKIYDKTTVTGIESTAEGSARITTTDGAVQAKFVIVAGAIDIPQMKAPLRRSISAMAHMIATEPLGDKRSRSLLAKDIAVMDAKFVMNYFRLSEDKRLLFGGNCNYTGRDFGKEDQELKNRMIDIFPELKMTRIDHCWSGPLDMTANRLPDIGRLAPNIFYAHGFGGHGVISTNILGKVLAQAVSGTAERFDVFEKIRHTPFFGGSLLKRPLFVLGMAWYKLRDMLL